MKVIEVSWFKSTLSVIPLLFIMYYILDSNPDQASGIIGVLILFVFNLFFFERRKYVYNYLTIFSFYCIGILGALIILYTQALWLLLFLVYAFIYTFYSTVTYTKIGEERSLSIDNELQNRKWYQKIWATKTQQKNNKDSIIDFAIFIVVIFLALWLYSS